MKFCTNCGAQLADDVSFCTNCGATTQPASQQTYTPQQAQPQQNYAPQQPYPQQNYAPQQPYPQQNYAPQQAYPQQAYSQQVAAQPSGLATAAKILMIISTVVQGLYIIPLAWCLPMTLRYNKMLKNNEPASTGFKVCTLLFVNMIAGILMLCDKKD